MDTYILNIYKKNDNKNSKKNPFKKKLFFVTISTNLNLPIHFTYIPINNMDKIYAYRTPPTPPHSITSHNDPRTEVF